MKNKAPLALIEQTIMLLVLAVAAALCVQVFLEAHLTAKEIHLHDLSLQQMENTAACLQASRGDLEKTAAIVGGTVENGRLTLSYDGYTITVERLPDSLPLLGSARLTATWDGKHLSQMEVSWQEVVP